jgi:hypothetical protein
MMRRPTLLLFAGLVALGIDPSPARACSCALVTAQLISPPPGRQIPRSFPIVVALGEGASFRIEGADGTPLPVMTDAPFRRLGLCSSSELVVRPLATWPPGGPYRLIPLRAANTASPSPDLVDTFFVADEAAPAIDVDVNASVTMNTHQAVIYSGNGCADPLISGRSSTRTLHIDVTARPLVDLLVTATVDDPLRGRLSSATIDPFIAWSSLPPTSFDPYLELPLFGDVASCADLEIRDLAGGVLLATRLCAPEDPSRSIEARALVAAIPPALAPRGCAVAGTPTRGPALSALVLTALVAVRRSRRASASPRRL